jgi:hypothetical protein
LLVETVFEPVRPALFDPERMREAILALGPELLASFRRLGNFYAGFAAEGRAIVACLL